MDRFDSLVQVGDDLLSLGGRSSQNLVNLTVGHFDDSVSECLESDIVSNHDHCDLLSHVEIDQNFHDNICATCVQITSRFIEEENLGLVGDGSRNGDSLLLATRELVREVVHSLFKTDILKQLSGSVANLLS